MTYLLHREFDGFLNELAFLSVDHQRPAAAPGKATLTFSDGFRRPFRLVVSVLSVLETSRKRAEP